MEGFSEGMAGFRMGRALMPGGRFGARLAPIIMAVVVITILWSYAWWATAILWGLVLGMVWLHTRPSFARRLTEMDEPAGAGVAVGPITQIPRAEGAAAIYGDARWATFDELNKILAPGSGFPILEAYRPDLDPSVQGVRYEPHDKATWGLGGQAYTFDFDPNRIGNGSGFLVAGAGGSKTVCFLSICLEWSGSLVVHDPAREIAPQVCAYRESLGRTVVLLDPKATDHRGSVNVMEKFDSTSPDVQSAVEDLAATLALYDPATSDDWVAYSKDFIQLLLGAEVFEHAPAKDAKPTLRAVYGRFAKGPAWLSKEYIPGLAEHAGSLWVRQMAARFNGVGTPEGLAPETWTSITNKTATALGWLGNESLCALVSDSTMSLDDLPRGKLDVFIQLGKQKSSSMPARILVEAFVGAMKAADGHHDERCLFLLDEAHGLCKGGFEEVQWVLTEGRKFGLSVLLGLQSEKQLNDCFGDNGAAMWRDSSAIRGYACTRDYETAKRLSDAIGTYTALEYSDSENTSSSESEQEKQGGLFSQGSGKSRSASDSRGRSVKPVKRDLISPQEIMDLRDDVGIFLITGCKPAIGSRAISYRRKEMVAKLGANRFAAKAAARANGEA